MSVCRFLILLSLAPVLIVLGTIQPGYAKPWPGLEQLPAPNLQWAQFNSGNSEGRPDWINQLNLSPEQVQRLRVISQQFRPQIQQRKQALNQLRADLRSMMSGAGSGAELRDKYRQIEVLQQEIRRIHFDSILAMREILTPEQRRQVEIYMRNRYQGGRRIHRHRN